MRENVTSKRMALDCEERTLIPLGNQSIEGWKGRARNSCSDKSADSRGTQIPLTLLVA